MSDFKKPGANPSDRAYIKRRAAEGATAEQISDEVRVDVACVESFMPSTGGESKKAPKKAPAPQVATEPDSDTTAQDTPPDEGSSVAGGDDGEDSPAEADRAADDANPPTRRRRRQ